MKKITINVDDLGLSDAVNQAVLSLAHMGRIHATSFMSGGIIRNSEVLQLQRLNIDIGLHLDLTGIAAQGTLKDIMRRSWLRLWDRAQLKRLIAQQFDLFESTIGQSPVFVDGHQHIHQFPVIRDILLEELMRRYPINSVLVRSTKPLHNDFKSRALDLLGGQTLRLLCAEYGISQNTLFGGVYDFQANMPRLQAYWRQWLQQAPPQGTLLMCHPAIADTNWHDSIKTARELEWAWLSSDAFAQLWAEYQCSEQHWSEWA